jgi:hypothetical protein
MALHRYIAPVFLTKQSEQPPLDVEHQIERSELWCILILGESMLSIVASVVPSPDVTEAQTTYATGALSFIIIYMMMETYMASQPHAHSGLDTHANDLELQWAVYHSLCQLPLTFSLFVLGVGLKSAMKYGTENDSYNVESGNFEPFKERNAWMISGAASTALVWITLSRYAHEWSNYCLFGSKRFTRKMMWMLQLLFSLSLLPVAMLVSTTAQGDTDTHTDDHADESGVHTSDGQSILVFLLVVLLVVVSTCVLDKVANPPKSIWKGLDEFVTAQEQLANSTAGGIDKHDSEFNTAFKAAAVVGTSGGLRTGGTKACTFRVLEKSACLCWSSRQG